MLDILVPSTDDCHIRLHPTTEVIMPLATATVSVCTDCVVFSANGFDGHCEDCYGDTVCETVIHWIAGVTTNWPDATHRLVRFVTDDQEPSFSWRRCEGCGTTLGGDRYQATALWEE